MSNETSTKADAQHGDEIANIEKNTDSNTGANTETKLGINTETKEPKEGKRTVSFNRDVHVKRFGKRRERGPSSESPSIRKEPFTHLSEQELIEEANKVIAQAQSVECTADHPPEKFFSLPHRRKFKEDRSTRRNSDDVSLDGIVKTPLGRSTSDVTPKKRKERTSLSTLFRRAQRTKSPESPVIVKTKPTVVVKRSKSDVSDLKSNTNLTKTKPIRKRSGSETEEFLKSLRNKKTQLSPIIESSPREDYFKKVSPLEVFQKQQLSEKESITSDTEQRSVTDYKKVNPIEKPPRFKGQDNQEPKPPSRSKRGKSSETEKEPSPPIGETPKRKVDIKKTNLAHDIDEKSKETPEAKDKIKDSVRKIEENVYGTKNMIHSSQQPPDKPPLTRGHTVDHMVRILKDNQDATPPKSHLISPSHGSNINQPFSYTKPSTSPDPNLFVRTISPERVSTPINKMNDKGVVYAQIIRDHDDIRTNIKQPMHKKFSPSREKYGNFSDEDEGLGYEDRQKYSSDRLHDYEYKNEKIFDSLDGFNVKESPIRPRLREYKLMSFDDLEPTYANKNPKKHIMRDPIESFRGRADGMDTKKKTFEPDTKIDLDFNELSHRRKLLESRLNARRYERERIINVEEPISRFLAETDPIYEAEKRMKQTEKYVNDTVKYYRHTLERDGFESNLTEDYKYDTDGLKTKYNTETRTFHKVPKEEVDRREYLDSLERPPRFKGERKVFPPEPEYEPPSLESNPGKPVSPDEYKEKKYKAKKNFISSHELLHSGHKYKGKDDWFGKRKGHYSSNPEIAQEREDEYANLRYNPKQESFHNSLRRVKNKDKDYKGYNSVRRHDSGDSRDYYREQMSPRRYDFDSRLVDSGIENDFRINSNGDIHKTRHRRYESEDDARNTSLFLANERQYAEDNYASEQIYANGDYLAKFKDYKDEDRKAYAPERNDDESNFDSKLGRHEKSPKHDEKVSAKPPKAKKLSGLEKVKQLFSRDSSKKSKKEKEKDIIQEKNRTRVLKSPEHLARHDSDYRRYTDPEPSDTEVRKIDHRDERKYKSSRENLDKYPREEKIRDESYKDSDFDERFDRTLERRYKERPEERRRHTSSERESDHQRDRESERRKTRSRTAGPLDSPALAERYRERRRLATPSPTPSPPRRQPTQSSGWFKSLDRLGKKREKNTKIEKESILTTEDESPRRAWTKSSKPRNSPAKNLRFFGDTDPESDANVKTVKNKNHTTKSHGTLRKTISNSSAGLDEVDHSELSSKSYSLSNLHRDEKRRDSESPRTKEYYKRNLQNISEMSNSEVESQFGRKMVTKPPISPYDRSRSHSSNKTLKGSKGDVRRQGRDDRCSSSELRNGKPEISRDLKHRRRTPVTNSGESSTEGDSSHQSQRSVVYLHATTVGDIPDPGRMARNRSRDDVSSVMSSNIQVRNSTKTFSIFAPWTPKHYNDQYDVHYAQKPKKKKETTPKKYSSTKNLTDDRPATLQKKSYSQTTLTRRPNSKQNNRLTSSSTTLYRSQKRGNDVSQSTIPRKSTNGRSQSSEILNRDERDRVSRSISIPKDKKAGWFKLSKNKKQENTRVR